MKILVLNSGSSSLKFKVFTKNGLQVLAEGSIQEIGTPSSSYTFKVMGKGHIKEGAARAPTHLEALEVMSSLLKAEKIVESTSHLYAVGHRVVHGGEYFTGAVLADKQVLKAIEELIPLAPLHNPSNLLGIKVAMEHAPNVPQVAVFDTAFHQSMPPCAFVYAIPKDLYIKHKVRRYGFHGTSYSYVTRQAARFLGTEPSGLSTICLHLGNGASAAAVKNGRCIDTSMGLTPLEGLVMGTRCGDIDPAIIFYLHRTLGMPVDEIDTLLNKNSGLKGLCGTRDMRAIEKMAKDGNQDADTALELFCYRIRKYIGAYLAAIGRTDCIVFTGGIGEHSSIVREKVINGLDHMGIRLDKEKNQIAGSGPSEPVDLSAPESTIKILVIPTNEELEIARQTIKVVEKGQGTIAD